LVRRWGQLAIGGVYALVMAQMASAQEEPSRAKTLFVRRDAVVAGAFLVASVGLSVFDPRIGRFFQDTSLNHVRVGQRLDDVFTHVNETTLTVGGLAVYGVARVAKSNTVADIAFHTTESVVTASLASQLIRGPLGRSRPRETDYRDQYDFHPFQGFGNFKYRAFPSIHSSSAFAAASAIVAETKRRNPGALRYVAPVAYAAALTPGLSRMYLGQHWASDVVAGAFVGTFAGWRVVNYSHTHPRTRTDRIFLNAEPTGVVLSWTF
jgi:membrane-associated phospholipid phosphatase